MSDARATTDHLLRNLPCLTTYKLGALVRETLQHNLVASLGIRKSGFCLSFAVSRAGFFVRIIFCSLFVIKSRPNADPIYFIYCVYNM